MLEDEVHLLDVPYVFRVISNIATMAKEKEYLLQILVVSLEYLCLSFMIGQRYYFCFGFTIAYS